MLTESALGVLAVRAFREFADRAGIVKGRRALQRVWVRAYLMGARAARREAALGTHKERDEA